MEKRIIIIHNGETSIRHLLQMSSGVKYSLDYTGSDDETILIRSSAGNLGPGGVNTVMPFKNNKRIYKPGTKFQYESCQTQVLGLVLQQAIGKSLADYLSEKIWQPMGAESDASWQIDKSGQEPAFCCFGATLRDFGRLGMLLANDGVSNGKQIVPQEWVREATQPTPGYPHLKPGVDHPYFGYGYQFWVFPGSKRRFALQGTRGQAIFVDPELKLVMVQARYGRASYIQNPTESAMHYGAVSSQNMDGGNRGMTGACRKIGTHTIFCL